MAKVSPIITLAFWRLRRTWFLLLVILLGLIAAVVVACAAPLFSTVTTTAGMRNILNATPASSNIEITSYTGGLSTDIAHDVQQRLDAPFQKHLKGYLSHATQFSLPISEVGVVPNEKDHSPKPPAQQYRLTLQGESMEQAMLHLTLVQGYFPRSSGNNLNLEIMLTPTTAQIWHVGVGSTVDLSFSFSDTQTSGYAEQPPNISNSIVQARVVGLFTVSGKDFGYWHEQNFEPLTTLGFPPITQFTFLCPSTTLLTTFDRIAAQNHIATAFNPGFPYELTWDYYLDSSKISITQLDDLTKQISALQADIAKTYGDVQTSGFSHSFYEPIFPYPYINQIYLTGAVLQVPPTPSTLDQFRDRVTVARIPVAIITLQIIALILFFVSMMIGLLVDRQVDAIAILRSRGASGMQIFGALLTQGIWLSTCALVIGLPLALLVVSFFIQKMFIATQPGVLNMITDHPVQSLLNSSLYALVIAFVAMLTIGFLLRRAINMDVLTVRREASRASRRPLWQRLNLDIVAAIVALIGYDISIYLTGLGGQLDARGQALIAVPLTLIAPLFLVIGFLFFFLRFFPWFLHLAVRIVGKHRSASSILALAQMARAPRQSMLMIILLTFALTLAIFTQIFIDSQAQHTLDLAAYETGADFRGPISSSSTSMPSLAEETAHYHSIPGILSATVGYSGLGATVGNSPTLGMQIHAVDGTNFAHTAIWPKHTSTQSLDTLMAQLVDKRADAVMKDVVPVFVDALAWNRLKLHVGSTFTIGIDQLAVGDLHCLVLGKIEQLPTVNDSSDMGISQDTGPSGAVLIDYQTYAAIYAQDSKQVLLSTDYLPINYFWLRTRSDSASLASVRDAIKKTSLTSDALYDRRALLDTMQHDPLYLNLIGILSLGAVAALLLAVVGDLLASLINARSRLSSFAVLRALGTTPRQVASILTWEQLIVYSSALLLGLLFGTLLSVTLTPDLVLSSVPASGNLSNLSSGEFYALQHIIQAQEVVPLSLSITFLVLIVICVFTLTMMVRVVSQPSLSQILRLNDD